MTVRILTIVGARPQFIKAAALSRAIYKTSGLQEIMIHTGQHYDSEMSDIFFEELAIAQPDYRLNVNGGGHGAMTGRMMEALEPIVLREKPDWVLVYGDTNSTLAGALVAAKAHIPVAHVEAGLRSFNRKMPEEINRVLTDHVATIQFCPTMAAVDNLRNEGIYKNVYHVGDVMFDATLHAIEKAEKLSTIRNKLSLEGARYAVATIHRAENTDDPKKLSSIIDYLRNRSQSLRIIMPLHPRTRAAIGSVSFDLSGLEIINPIGYLDMAQLLSSAQEVITDSGGLQKEAYFHKIPCTTLRDETEWVETISHGWNRLWNNPWNTPRSEITDYGTGKAAIHIAEILREKN